MRWLVSPSPYGQGHRLGVIWLHDPDEHHLIDGDHLSYLHPTHDEGEDLRSLDPDLYDRLRLKAARSGRALSVRETCDALPTDSVRFDRPLRFDDLLRDDRAAREVGRQRWFHEAMVAVTPCSLVFLDCDNGANGVSMPEVGQLLERGQSVVTHRLVDASQATPRSVMTDLHNVKGALGVEPSVLLRTTGDGAQLFTVIPHRRHQSGLQDCIGALQLSRWGDEFRVHRWRPSLVTA